MTTGFIAMVEHRSGKQIVRIDAPNILTAENRLKALGYVVLSIGVDA